MGLIALENEIPADHRDKAAIEAAIRAAVGNTPGSWHAGVLWVRDAPWWVVFVRETGRGFKRSTLLDTPWKQRPESVKSIVRDLMQERRRVPRRLSPSRA